MVCSHTSFRSQSRYHLPNGASLTPLLGLEPHCTPGLRSPLSALFLSSANAAHLLCSALCVLSIAFSLTGTEEAGGISVWFTVHH